MSFCCFCKHHSFEVEGETENQKIRKLMKPYSAKCKCDLGRKEHHYFPTFGNDCCIISPTYCNYFDIGD